MGYRANSFNISQCVSTIRPYQFDLMFLGFSRSVFGYKNNFFLVFDRAQGLTERSEQLYLCMKLIPARHR